MSEGEEQVNLTREATDAPVIGGWTPEGNPVESFTSSIEQALRQLSLELAAIRAERDGLRLELEGLRAQYELLRHQVHDRDRFAATVRELGDIVRMLNVPVSWTEAPAPSQHAAPPPPPEPTVPLVAEAPPAAPAAAPDLTPPAAPAVPAAPAAWHPPAVAAEPDPFAWASASDDDQPETDWSTYLGTTAAHVAAPAVDVTPAADVPEPAASAASAPPLPTEQATWAAPAPWTAAAPVEAAPPSPAEPDAAAEPEPLPEPELRFVLPPRDEPTGTVAAATPSTDLRFDVAGIWQLADPVGDRRHRRGRDEAMLWGKRIGSALGALLILALLLVSVGPKVLPYQTFFVRSGSMEPTIEVGELIVLTRVDAADLEEGDIITFERPDRAGVMVTHRIVAVETTATGKVFQTKGDANGSPDTWRVPAHGEGWKHAFGIPKVGYVFGYLNTPQARLAMLAVPAVILGLLSLIDIWKPSTSSKQPARRRH